MSPTELITKSSFPITWNNTLGNESQFRKNTQRHWHQKFKQTAQVEFSVLEAVKT